jgi:hypothetical protein
VAFDGTRADGKLRRDLFTFHSLAEHSHNLDFSLREAFERDFAVTAERRIWIGSKRPGVRIEYLRDLRSEEGPIITNVTQCVEQLVVVIGFQDVSTRTRL